MRSRRDALLCALVMSASLVAPARGGEPAGKAGKAAKLLAGGATFPLPLYERWFKEYGKDHPGFAVDYQPLGTAKAKIAFSSGGLDFAGVDVPLSDEELRKAQAKCLHLPMTLGAVVPIYNLPELARQKATLRLSGPTLAEIYLGRVTSWDDDLVAADNPGVKLPKQPIRVLHRSDPSGITYVFNDYLSKVSPEWAQRVGVTAEPKAWPHGTGAYRNVGVAERVQRTPYSIGYVEITHALSHKLPHAAVRNAMSEYVQGSYASITAAAAAVRVPSDYRVSVTNAKGPGAYPIASYTWLVVNLFMEDKAKAAALRDFLKWAVGPGQALNEALGFARLPEGVARREALDIASLHY